MSTMSGLHLEQLQEAVEQQRAEIERLRDERTRRRHIIAELEAEIERLRLKVPDRDKLLAEIERLHEELADVRRDAAMLRLKVGPTA